MITGGGRQIRSLLAAARAGQACCVGSGRRRQWPTLPESKEDLVLDPEPVEELRERIGADIQVRRVAAEGNDTRRGLLVVG